MASYRGASGLAVRADGRSLEVSSADFVVREGATVIGGVSGLVRADEAGGIVAALRRADDPGWGVPDAPWAAVVRRPDGTVAAAGSTMLPSSILFSQGIGGDGPWLAVATDAGAALDCAVGPAQLDPDWAAGTPQAAGVHATPFLGLRGVLSGDTLLWRAARDTASVRFVQWCGPDTLPEPDRCAKGFGRRYLAVFDEVAADLAMRCGPPVVQMSAGLDSTFLAAALALAAPAPYRVHCYTYSPMPQWRLDSAKHLADEYPGALAMEEAYPGRLTVTALRNTAGDLPAGAAAQMTRRSWLPCPTPESEVWMRRVRRAALDLGARGFFVGASGNASFSHVGTHVPEWLWHRRRYAAFASLLGPSSATGRPRGELLRRMVRAVPAGGATAETRRGYLEWLTARGAVSGAAGPAALEGLWRIDPFRSRAVLHLAATMPPQLWWRGGGYRGFARTLSSGRVPDSIRLRRSYGLQSWDVAMARGAPPAAAVSLADVASSHRVNATTARRIFMAAVAAGDLSADRRIVVPAPGTRSQGE